MERATSTQNARLIPPEELPPSHFWLERPFAANYVQWAAQNFPYGSRGNGKYVLHTGADIGNPLGTPVLAVGDGVVAYAGDDSKVAFGPWIDYYGSLIVIELDRRHDDQPVFVLYGHLGKILIRQGDRVRTGDVIGEVGMTGIALGPHLHIEVRLGEFGYQATRNPEFWLRNLPGYGALAGRVVGPGGEMLHGRSVLVYRLERLGSVWMIAPTYPDEPEINADNAWHENFLLADVPAGRYLVEAGDDQGIARIVVEVLPNAATFVELELKGASVGSATPS